MIASRINRPIIVVLSDHEMTYTSARKNMNPFEAFFREFVTSFAAGSPEAKGVMPIANDGNFLHTGPADYLNLVARVLQKRKPDDPPRFPHIDGVIYFSYRVPMRGERTVLGTGTLEP